MIDKPLPEFCKPGRKLEAVDGVVVHYFSARHVDPDNEFDLQTCYNLMVDLNRDRDLRRHYMKEDGWPDKRSYASAHIFIGREGEIWHLIDLEQQAWHAGKSILGGRSGCNRWTVGIELIGAVDSGFSKAQYQALVSILVYLEGKYGIDRDNVAGHDQVRYAAIQAGFKVKPKYDPSGRVDGMGDNFNWFYLGKMWNDTRLNPAGVATLADLDAVLAADPLSD